MALDIYHVHAMEHDRRTNQMVMVGKKPYKRFVSGSELPINVQGGKFYFDEGKVAIPPADVPLWVTKQVKKMTPESLRSLGFESDKEEKAPPPPELPDDLGANDRETIDSDDVEEEETWVEDADEVSEDSEPPDEVSEEIAEEPLTLELVLDTLDHTDGTHWNASGKPDLNYLKEMMGRYISRQLVNELAPDLERNG